MKNLEVALHQLEMALLHLGNQNLDMNLGEGAWGLVQSVMSDSKRWRQRFQQPAVIVLEVSALRRLHGASQIRPKHRVGVATLHGSADEAQLEEQRPPVPNWSECEQCRL